MGFRLFRRVRIAPGVSLNFSKSGISTSFGIRGAHVTLGRRGVRKTIGVPGTGLYYTHVDSWAHGQQRSRQHTRRHQDPPAPPPPRHTLDLGFFQRLVTPKQEQAFVDGCKAYVAGDKPKALAQLRNATHLADGAFLAGFLAFDAKRLDETERYLRQALAGQKTLGTHFAKYEMHVELALPIGHFVVAHLHPCKRGVLMGLAQVYQAQDRAKEALDCLKQLRKDTQDDVVVNVSMAEIVMEAAPHDKRLAKQIVELAGDVHNESPVHATLMLYKARALRTLGLDTAAKEVLTAALRKRKGRDDQLLREIRYERACVNEELGRKAAARRDFERLYAEDPSFEDVAKRLGL